MDEQTRIQVCGLIAGILSSDEDVDIHEAAFLQRIRKRFELPKGTSVPLLVGHDEALAALQGFSDEDQQETLKLLIAAAAVDGKIAPAERSFLGVVADKLGVASEELDERLRKQLVKSKPQPFGFAPLSEDD